MWWRKNQKSNNLSPPICVRIGDKQSVNSGQKFEHVPQSRSAEIQDHIARTQSSPFFPIKNAKLAQKIRVALAESLENRENKAQRTARLIKLVQDPKLAEEIGHTESVYIYYESMIRSGQESGATDKEWYNAGNPCEDCLALNNKQVKLDGRFSTKDKIGHPPLHFVCNCGMRLVYGKGFNLGL